MCVAEVKLTLQYDGAYLNGLLIIPSWARYFGNPAGQDLGLITASFYFVSFRIK